MTATLCQVLSLCFWLLVIPSTSQCSLLSEEEYVTHQELENALLNSYSNETVPNLYILADAFFPLQMPEPVCLPVQYRIDCEAEKSCTKCINCSDSTYKTAYLWTGYDVHEPIGSVLMSYALDGIELMGFNSWEGSCLFTDSVVLYLNLSSVTYSNEVVVLKTLTAITSQLKKYAAAQGRPKVGDTDYNGFAIQWNAEDQSKVFDAPNVLLTVEFIFLNIFIYFLSISMTTYAYDNLYKNVKYKKNPGYPLFWGLVVFTVCWNVGPSWLVFVRYSTRVRYSLAVMIPLHLIAALLVKKKSGFPIPGMSPQGCRMHRSRYHFIWELAVITCCRCFITHIVQALAIWSILVSFTFLVYYLSAIIVTFYLYPTVTLIKVVFLKGTAVCIILVFALVFSLSKFKFKCTLKAAKSNCVVVFSLLTVVSFMPILGYLAFVIGGILFTESADSNTLKSVLTLLPSAFLLFVAWVSRGHLFPEGLHDTDPAKEIASDLEKGKTHEKKHPNNEGDDNHVQVPLAPSPPARAASKHGQTDELSSYGSTDNRESLTLRASIHSNVEDERKPLLPS